MIIIIMIYTDDIFHKYITLCKTTSSLLLFIKRVTKRRQKNRETEIQRNRKKRDRKNRDT